jgi:two-component system NarL family sensor kinase
VRSFDENVRERLLVAHVARVKIWNADGLVVYSDEADLIGEEFTLDEDAREVIGTGKVEAGVSELDRPENRYEISPDGYLEVYTRIYSPEGHPLLFEVYHSADELEQNTETIFSVFRPISVGPVLLLALLTTPLLWVMTRRLARSAEAREQLFTNAVGASQRERRRIARDLHEGVVQDLSAASTALAGEASTRGVSPALALRLNRVDDTLRSSVRSLRSLVLEIYPPNLDASRLPAALDELVTPAETAGLEVKVDVADMHGVDDDIVALVWRAAQESVRNATRHARARRLDLSVRRTGRTVALRVTDDGVGFVPGAFSHAGRFGLQSLHDLAREAGGHLHVESGPGRGTTVHLEVPAC